MVKWPKKVAVEMHEAGPQGPLTDDERSRLAWIEGAIDAAQKAYYQLGAMLMELRTRRLYRETHKNWDRYIRDRFGIDRRHADRLCAATNVTHVATNVYSGVKLLKYDAGPVGPVCDLENFTPAPIVATERHARELLRADQARREIVCKKLTEMAAKTGENPTAADVRKIVDQVGIAPKKAHAWPNASREAMQQLLDGEHVAAIEAIANSLAGYKRRLAASADGPAGRYLGRELPELNRIIDAVADRILAALPYCECPMCHAKGCVTCESGYLTKSLYDRLSDNLKAEVQVKRAAK